MVRASQFFSKEDEVRRANGKSSKLPADAGCILMVSNDKSAHRLVRSLAGSLSFALVEMADVHEAVEFAKQHRPDLIICDVNMPGDGGYELCRQLRQILQTQTTPFMFLANQGETPDQTVGFQTGADDYICRPFDDAEFKKRVAALLRRGKEHLIPPRPVASELPPSLFTEPSQPEPEPPPEVEEEKLDVYFPSEKDKDKKRKKSAPETAAEPPPPAAEPPRIEETPAKPKKVIEPAPEAPSPEPVKAAGYMEQSAGDVFQQSLTFMEGLFSQIQAGNRVSISPAREIVSSIIGLPKEDNSLVRRALSKNEYHIPTHSVNVTIFAIRIAHGLQYRGERLIAVGMAALLHDIGLASIADNVLQKKGKLTDKEFQTVMLHPRQSADIILASEPDNDTIAEIVHQHHERENGQGYPRGLRGNEILEEAKIIGVADTFDALSHPRTYRKDFIAFEAMQKVIELRDETFPARIIKSLMNEISIYPLGSYIRLNTGEIGKVTKVNKKNVLRPKLTILLDTDGRPLPAPRDVNLEGSPLLSIADAVDERELPSHSHGS